MTLAFAEARSAELRGETPIGAALVRDGTVIAASEEERFTHRKHAKRPVPFSTWELPYHAIDDGRWVEGVIGPKRIQSSYAWRSLLDAGATLAFGSDWPVAPLDPLAGIYAAVTRRTLDGKNPRGWTPEQRITVAQAVHAYTMGSAYAEHQEDQRQHRTGEAGRSRGDLGRHLHHRAGSD